MRIVQEHECVYMKQENVQKKNSKAEQYSHRPVVSPNNSISSEERIKQIKIQLSVNEQGKQTAKDPSNNNRFMQAST